MRYLCKRIGLIHKLAQGIGTEEAVDDTAQAFACEQVRRTELLVVAYIHTLANGANHTCQADGELVGKLLAHGADATVAQVVNIIDAGLGVDEFYQILDNLDDVLLGEHSHIRVCVETQLVVDAVAAHVAQVITLLAEEEVEYDLLGAGIVNRVSVAQLLVDVADGFLLTVRGILLESVEDDAVIGGLSVFLVNEDRSDVAA